MTDIGVNQDRSVRKKEEKMGELLLRQESFGGTLCSVTTGKRIYLDRTEFTRIKMEGSVTGKVASEIGQSGEVRVVSPGFLPDNNFSFPDTVYFEVTRHCNLSCKQCFNGSGQKMADELSLQRQLELVEKLAGCGAQEVRFTGGEPLSHSGIYELISKASQFGLRVTIGTNATTINNERADRLAQAGLHGAVVSIDGEPTVHDRIRGAGSFEKSLAGIWNLCDAGIDTRINTTAMRDNFSTIPELATFFHQKGLRMFIRRLMPQGRAGANWSQSVLTKKEYAWLRSEMRELLENPDGLVYGHYLREKNFQTRIRLPFLRSSCTIGQRAIVIEPDGKIGLCGFLKQDKLLFDVQTMELDEIWKQIAEIDPVKALELEKMLKKHNLQHELRTDCYAVAHGARQWL